LLAVHAEVRQATTAMESNENDSRRRARRQKIFAGYLPFTALGILIPLALVSFSGSWAATLAGGVILLIWSAAIAVFQLPILFFKVDSDFYLKCVGMTAFSVFGAPFVVGGLNGVAVAIFIGKPDLDGFLRERTSNRCEILKIKDERRMGRRTYYISGIVSCEPENKEQSCSWWFHKADTWTTASKCPAATGLPAEG